MKNITLLWTLFTLRISISNVIAIPDVVLDYCLKDAFAAECPDGYVVFMEEARYGRMELGTCLKMDIGFMGCSSDVLSILDQWCSGQQSCRFNVINIRFIIDPCPEEVTTYLQARYTCLKVMTPQEHCCQTVDSNIIDDATNGFLASSITVQTGCGYNACPWIIHVHIGQLLNISLYDFGTYNAGLIPSDGAYDDGFDNQCHRYAIIREMEDTIAICAGQARMKDVYTSISNTVQIQVMNNQQNDPDQANFLIGFEAMGCPDPDPPLNSLVQRKGSYATIKCSLNGNMWEIECHANEWQGDLNSCYHPSSTTSPGERNIASVITGDVFIAFVVALTFVISVAIITTGVVCYQRNRYRNPARRQEKPDNAMWMMNTLDGAYATQEFEYSHTNLPHHYHRENYIYYLTKQEMQNKIHGPTSSTERENDNGYYSDHTYESPRCEHIQPRRHSISGNNQCDSYQFGPELTPGRICAQNKNICGTMHGDDVLFPKSTKEYSEEECIFKTV